MIKQQMQEDFRFDNLEAALDEVNQEMERILLSAPLIIKKYMEHLSLAKGKCIRAYSLLACAMDGSGSIHRDAVIAASAIEVMHLATLVHDDVMDDAKLRRGIPTLQNKFGKKTAVICGDYLLAASLKQLTKISKRETEQNICIPDYVSRVCLGELQQHINNGNLEISMLQYFSIIKGKTAALFEAAFYAGAFLAEEEDKHKLYRRLGNYIGMIFQLTDDCIDFEAKELQAQKNVQSDLEQGVITLPLIYTFLKKPELKELVESNSIKRSELNAQVAHYGGLSFTKSVSQRYYQKAQIIMNELSLSKEKEAHLQIVLDKAFYGLKTGGLST